MFDFIPEEIAEKKRRVKTLMEELGLDAIYLKKSSNFAWVTGGGYNIVGMATEMGVAGALITANREYIVCSNIEAPRMEKEKDRINSAAGIYPDRLSVPAAAADLARVRR
jgi:Xaa-Pro aminopeptidase